jgi:hypothetical protein
MIWGFSVAEPMASPKIDNRIPTTTMMMLAQDYSVE